MLKTKQKERGKKTDSLFFGSAYACFHPRTSLLKLLTFIRGSPGSFPFGSQPLVLQKTSGIPGSEGNSL